MPESLLAAPTKWEPAVSAAAFG